LTMVAVALALLLGVGSVGFYFAKDFNLPPINVVTNNAPDLTPPRQDESKLGSVARPDRPPTDSRERTTEFLTAYNGGDCFFITPERLSEARVTRDVDGLGSAREPFDDLVDEFKRRFGSEAEIGLNKVAPEQCPAVNFLYRTRNQPGTAPRLDIVTTGLVQDPPMLSGLVSEFGERHVEVLLIPDDGYVLSVTERLKPTSNGKTFTIGLRKIAGPPRPMLVFAIASSKPLQALNLPTNARGAEVFPRLLTEASQRSLTLNVRARFFLLE
jgi:hypothetical protein